jgi:hypothetical protein
MGLGVMGSGSSIDALWSGLSITAGVLKGHVVSGAGSW